MDVSGPLAFSTGRRYTVTMDEVLRCEGGCGRTNQYADVQEVEILGERWILCAEHRPALVPAN